MALAPIIVFSYDRPDHLRKTLNSLSNNIYAEESDLFIFCDGAKDNASELQVNRILENRNVAQATRGFKSVKVFLQEKNRGLANSIIEGVSAIINEFGRAIVLEDDLLTSPFFLKYMNEALDYYDKRKSVFSIGACRPPMNKMQIPSDYEYDVFVGLRSYSWGWATWKDRWSQVEWSMDYMDSFLKHPEQVRAFNRAGEDMTKLLKMQYDGKIDSWAMRFGFAHFYQHAIAILPCISYVDNIGFDGSGTHCENNSSISYTKDIQLAKEHCRFLDVLYEDSRIINAFYSSFYSGRRPLWQKACNYIARKMGRRPPFVIKKKVYV